MAEPRRVLLFRCRLCGEQYTKDAPATGPIEGTLMGEAKWLVSCFHMCSEKSAGIGELLGVREGEEN